MQRFRVYSILYKFVTVNHCDHSPSEVEFYPMEADGTDYPNAVLPILPPASLAAWSVCREVEPGSVFLKGTTSFTQGRYALHEAMRRVGVMADTVVLLPAFHCRSMVEPVLLLGATACFYPVGADLRPDFTALPLLWREGKPAVVMVLTHYFGFPNALDEAEQFCARHGIALIEDCAHAFYGQAGGRLLGSVGRYAVASPWKFLPVRDGGLLRDNTEVGLPRGIEQSWLAEIKAVVAMLQTGLRHLRPCCELPVIDSLALAAKAQLIVMQGCKQVAEQGLKEMVPARLAVSALRLSRWGTRHTAHRRVTRLRRENYLRWQEGVRDLTGVRSLFPCLPDGVVPYVFPLLVDALGFHLFKLAGIPLWRWEDMAVTDCAVSQDYRLRLLQLPCHQELREDELAWMIATVRLLSHQLESCSGQLT